MLSKKFAYVLLCLLLIQKLNGLCFAEDRVGDKQCRIAHNMGNFSGQLSLDRAIYIYVQAQSLCPDSYALNYNLGRLYFEKGLYLKAEHHLHSALKIQNQPEARLLLAHSLSKRGLEKHAEEQFLKASSENPDSAKVIKESFYQMTKNGNFKLALQLAERLFKNDNYQITKEDYYNLGFVHEQLSNSELAKKAYQDALVIDSKYLKANYNLGLRYFKEQTFKKAKQRFLKVIKIEPRHIDSLRMLSNIYALESNLPDQIKTLKSLLQIDNQDFEAQKALGFAYFKDKKYELSELELRKANAIEKDHEVVNTLGYFALERGELRNAELYFKEALSLSDYSSSNADNNLRILKQRKAELLAKNRN